MIKTPDKNSSFLLNRIKSFKFAFKGILFVVKKEPNTWIHITAAILVICAGLFFRINSLEWVLVSVAIGIVIVAEMFNTAIEEIVNIISPEYNKKAGIIKDISAGAVLVAAITSICIGIFVFGKYIILLIC